MCSIPRCAFRRRSRLYFLYGEKLQCTPKELAILLEAFSRVANTFDPADDIDKIDVKSVTLRSIIVTLPAIRNRIAGLLSDIKLAEARENNMENLWRDEDKYPAIENLTFVSGINGL